MDLFGSELYLYPSLTTYVEKFLSMIQKANLLNIFCDFLMHCINKVSNGCTTKLEPGYCDPHM